MNVKLFEYHILLIIFISILCFGQSCGNKDDGISIPVKSISNLEIKDNSNLDNASDLEISFTKARDEVQILEYRIIVVGVDYDENLDLVSASSLNDDLYQSITPTGTNISVRLDPDIKTISGEALLAEQFYIIYVLSVSNGTETTANRLSAPSRSFKFSDKSDPVEELFLTDIGNEQNATDFQLRFIKPLDESKISAYRIVLIKSEKVDDFTVKQAEGLGNMQYVQLPTRSLDQIAGIYELVNFPITFLDTDREAIRTNQLYSAVIISVEDGINALSKVLSHSSNELSIENVSFVRTISNELHCTGGLSYHPDGYLIAGNTDGFFRSKRGSGTCKIELDGSSVHQTIELKSCRGNAYSSSQGGVIYQATKDGIYKIFNDGTSMLGVAAGIGRLGILNSATDVVVSSRGTYVANCDLPKLYQLKSGGQQALEIHYDNRQGLITCPRYIEVDNGGRLIVMNYNDHKLYKFTNIAFGEEPTLHSQLPFGENFVSIVYVPSHFSLYATTSKNRIVKIPDLLGEVEQFAGNGTPSIVDGSLELSSFIRPVNITASTDGNTIYVLDETNESEGISVLRKIELVEE